MGTLLNRRRYMGGGNESILPTGYTELKWITNNGSGYIDTGLLTSTLRKIETSLLVPNSSALKIWETGGATSGVLYSIRFTDNTITGYTPNASYLITSSYDGASWCNIVLDIKKRICTFNGTDFTVPGNLSGNTYREFLFAYSQLGNVNHNFGIKGSMGRTKYYEDDVLVRDYVPCISPNNVVGMYDLINEDFHGHNAFIAGDRK